MFKQDKSQSIVVNYNIDTVYDAIIKGVDRLSNMSVRNANKITHSVTINVSMSLFSWGEQMTVSLNDISDDKTEILISSGSKLGTEIAANTKNRKNINELMDAMSMYLK